MNRLPLKEGALQMAKKNTVSTPVSNSRPVIAPTVDRVLSGRSERVGSRLGPESMPPFSHEEVLVVDDRAALRPAQVVETKLTRLLQEASLPVSHLQMRAMLRTR
jgi:hypothetical protein